MPEEPERRALADERMSALIALALLPCCDNGPPRGVVHHDPTAVELAEPLGAQLSTVYQGKGQPVGEDGAKFLHQIEREARPARAVAVEITDLGVEPLGFQRAADVMRQQCIEER